MNAHPQAIDLSQLNARPRRVAGRLPASATLLVWCALVPTLWMGAVVALAFSVRY